MRVLIFVLLVIIHRCHTDQIRLSADLYASTEAAQLRSLLTTFEGCNVHFLASITPDFVSDEVQEWMRSYYQQNSFSGSALTSEIFGKDGNLTTYLSKRRQQGHTRGYKFPNPCCIQIYLPDGGRHADELWYDGEMNFNLSAHLQKMKENPDFIIIFVQRKGNEDLWLLAQQLKGFERGMMTKFLFIHNRGYVDLVCFSGNQNSVYFNIQTSRGFSTLINVWNALHRNLQNALVSVNFFTDKDCHKLSYREGQYASLRMQYCLVSLLKEKFNFTVNLNYIGKTSRASIRVAAIADMQLVETIRDRSNKHRAHWMIGGDDTKHFSVSFVADRTDMNVAAYFEALDWRMWAATVAVALIVTAVITGFIATTKAEISWRIPFSVSAVVVVFFFDQCVISKKDSGHYSKIHIAIVLFIWAQIATIVSNEYRGALCSLLVTFTAPEVPESMEQIIASPHIVFCNQGCRNVTNGPLYSVIHTTISDTLRSTESEERSHHVLRRRLEIFGNRVQFSERKLSQLVVSRLLRQKSSDEIDLLSNYLYIGLEEHNTMHITLLQLLSGASLVTISGGRLEFFVQHIPMVITGPPFANMAQDIISRATESGLWNRLQVYYGNLLTVLTYRRVLKQIQIKMDEKTGSQGMAGRKQLNVMALLITGPKGLTSAGSTGKETPLPMSVLKVVFVSLLIPLVFACLCLAGEIVRHKKTKPDVCQLLKSSK